MRRDKAKASSKDTTNEWYTPKWVIDALGGKKSFDLDPCAPSRKHWTAKKCLTEADNGLTKEWRGRVFLNPPYGAGLIDPWLTKMAMHSGGGIALIPAGMETNWFQTKITAGKAMFVFLRRLKFEPATGKLKQSNGSPAHISILIAFSDADVTMVEKAMIAEKLDGLLFYGPIGAEELATGYTQAEAALKGEEIPSYEEIAARLSPAERKKFLGEWIASLAENSGPDLEREIATALQKWKKVATKEARNRGAKPLRKKISPLRKKSKNSHLRER